MMDGHNVSAGTAAAARPRLLELRAQDPTWRGEMSSAVIPLLLGMATFVAYIRHRVLRIGVRAPSRPAMPCCSAPDLQDSRRQAFDGR